MWWAAAWLRFKACGSSRACAVWASVASGMAELVRHVRRDQADTVSLYVNDFNTAAIGAYESAGFERVGMFATVMF